MGDKTSYARQILSTFKREVNRYDDAGGDIIPSNVRDTLSRRVHENVIARIKELTEQYDAPGDFIKDYPELTDLVGSLATLDVKDGQFDLNDLSKISKKLQSPETTQDRVQLSPAPMTGNPFVAFSK